jgi:hypothetical protein
MSMHYFTTIVVKIRVLSEYESSLTRQILCTVRNSLFGTTFSAADIVLNSPMK